jgi:hypothetical protein
MAGIGQAQQGMFGDDNTIQGNERRLVIPAEAGIQIYIFGGVLLPEWQLRKMG